MAMAVGSAGWMQRGSSSGGDNDDLLPASLPLTGPAIGKLSLHFCWRCVKWWCGGGGGVRGIVNTAVATGNGGYKVKAEAGSTEARP